MYLEKELDELREFAKEQVPRKQRDSVRDLALKTEFSQREVKALYRSFKMNCPAGQVSKKQFFDIFARLVPSGESQHYAQYVFATFDLDENGYISFEVR